MTEENKQAVTDETDKTTESSQEAGSGARTDDLDELLSEYDEGTSKSVSKPDKGGDKKAKPEPKSEADGELLDQVKQLVAAQTQRERDDHTRRFNEDMSNVVKNVRGELDAGYFDDNLVRAWIDAQAMEHPKLADAWANRNDDPKRFQRVVDQLGRDFTKKYGTLPDKQLTEDREAVTAAVRGSSTKAPEDKAPDVAKMSDAEYRAHVRKTYGYDPQV